MGVRRKTANRLTLVRRCGTCGREFTTTADSPWMRSVPRDGKKQAITYYCSSPCFQASYKHIGWYDGKTAERKKARDARRDRSVWWKTYYEKNGDALRARRMERYYENRESELANNAYYRRKRRLIAEEGVSEDRGD